MLFRSPAIFTGAHQYILKGKFCHQSGPEKPVDRRERPIVPTIQTTAHLQPPPTHFLSPSIPPPSPYNRFSPSQSAPGFHAPAHYASHFTSSPSSYAYSPSYSPSPHVPSPQHPRQTYPPPEVYNPHSPASPVFHPGPHFHQARPQLSIPSLIESALRADPSRQSTVASIVDWITTNHPSETRKRKTWEDLVRAALNSDPARFAAVVGEVSGEEEGQKKGEDKSGEKGRRGRIWRLKAEDGKDESSASVAGSASGEATANEREVTPRA